MKTTISIRKEGEEWVLTNFVFAEKEVEAEVRLSDDRTQLRLLSEEGEFFVLANDPECCDLCQEYHRLVAETK